MMRGEEATSELRLLVAKESSSESRSTLDGHATSATVVLTVAAVRWHRAREKTGAPSADGRSAGHTVTYSFVADRPGTFTYHARYGRDRATGLVDTGPSAGRRARAVAGHGVVNVPRSDQGPSADSRAGRAATTAVRRVDGRARGRRGMASIEAQLMADCPVIRYDEAEYGGGPPVGRLLRFAGAALAAAALWVSGICGPRDPD